MRGWRIALAGTLVLVSCGESDSGAGGSGVVEEPTCGSVVDASHDIGGAVSREELEATSIAESTRLEPMLGAVLAYGGEHPESFGGYGFTWHAADDASVFVGFSADIAVHRDALVAMVELPDELIVCRTPMNETEAAALLAELEPELRGRGASIRHGGGRAIGIELRPGDEAYAAELHARYGDRVDLTVGRFPYPMPDPLPPSECEPLPDAATVAGLEITIDPLAGPVDPLVTATVRLHNGRDEPIRFGTGSPRAVLVEPGTANQVGGFYGEVRLPLTPVDVQPGGEQTLDMPMGAVSCDPAVGYRVPPGQYELIGIIERAPAGSRPLLTEPLAVEVSTEGLSVPDPIASSEPPPPSVAATTTLVDASSVSASTQTD